MDGKLSPFWAQEYIGADLKEARMILQKTALPTSNRYQHPQLNGVGTLNTLKSVALAQRLTKKGLTKADRKALLTAAPESGIFDFSEESKKAFDDGMALLELPDIDKNCDRRREGLNLIRKSLLLQTNEKARLKLIELYKGQGLELNAEFYENFDRKKLVENLAWDAQSPNRGVRQSVARTASYLPEAFPTLAGLFGDINPVDPDLFWHYEGFPRDMNSGTLLSGAEAAIISLTSQYTPKQLKALVENMLDNKDPRVRALAPFAALRLDIGAMDYIDRAIDDKHPGMMESGLAALGWAKDNKRKYEYFAKYIDHPNPRVAEAASVLGAMLWNEPDRPATSETPEIKGKPYRDSARRKLLESNNPQIRIRGIEMVAKDEPDKLAELAKKEMDPNVLNKLSMEAASRGRMDALKKLYSKAGEKLRNQVVHQAGTLNASNNDSDLSILISAVHDPSKEIRKSAATWLLGLGLPTYPRWNRFKQLDEKSIHQLRWDVIQVLTDQWNETKSLPQYWEQDGCLSWFSQYVQHPNVPQAVKSSLSAMISAAQSQQAQRQVAGN